MNLHSRIYCTIFIIILGCSPPSYGMAQTVQNFSFHKIVSLSEMSNFIKLNYPVGSNRKHLRQVFVTQGLATMVQNPTQSGVEKYIYDINLCRYYVWRWNISVDFDKDGLLTQAYVNAERVFPDGKPPRALPQPGSDQKAAIYRMQKARPEADKGEKSLAFLLFDRDANLATTADQEFAGGMPSRADPLNLGSMRTVIGDPWRSIFDSDKANFIAPFSGDCTEVDAAVEKLRASGRSH